MHIVEFVPNAIKNKGKTFDKNGGKARPEPQKKRTEIPNAIKTVKDVSRAIEKAKDKAKHPRENTEASGRSLSAVPKPARLSRSQKAPHKVQKPARKGR